MKTYDIRLAAGAVRDLNDIYDYLCDHQSEADADHVFNSILDAIDDLRKYPNRGACPSELRSLGLNEYREVFFKPYRIIYSVESTLVYIRIIADGRRDFRRLLSRRLLR